MAIRGARARHSLGDKSSMHSMGLSDLSALVLTCRNPKARSYLAEAVTCLNAGAFRASIVVTWVAVVHDLLAKLEQLALAGDNNAQRRVDDFRRIVGTGDTRASLEFERSILDFARDEFELFGPLAYVDLVRLRDDRNRCAHPSMIDEDTDYQPPPELARCHLVNAVTHLLQHGPAQGRAALKRLLGELRQTYFPKSVEELVIHLEHGPLGKPRSILVRNYTVVLLKEYFADAPTMPTETIEGLRARMERAETKRRLTLTIQAVVRMHREIAVAAVDEKLDGIVAQASDAHLGPLLVLAASPTETWHALSQAQRNRVLRYVREMPSADFGSYLGAAWAIGDVQPAARERISRGDSWDALAKIADPPLAWTELALDQMLRAATWDEANPPKGFLVTHADQLTEQHARALLKAAKLNDQLRSSWGAKDTLDALSRCANVGPSRIRSWIEDAGLGDAYSSEKWWPKDAASGSGG